MAPKTIAFLESRIEEVETSALELGYPKLGNKKNKRTGIGRTMPNATELIGLVLDEEEMYRLLSAVAHGYLWAHIQLGYKPITLTEDQSQYGGIDVQPMEKHVLIESLAYLGLGAAKAFAKPIWYYRRYMGWTTEPLLDLFEKVYEKLEAGESAKFWRCSG